MIDLPNASGLSMIHCLQGNKMAKSDFGCIGD